MEENNDEAVKLAIGRHRSETFASESSKYTKTKKIGEGTYGVVYQAVNNETGQSVAIKSLWSSNENWRDGIPQASLREIAVLRSLDHVNIVGIKDVIRDESGLYMVMDFMKCDLNHLLASRQCKGYPGLADDDIMQYSYQLLQATTYCHSHRIVHRDLKPHNILIDPATKSLKIADFGLARAFRMNVGAGPLTQEVVTLWYRPPELLLGVEEYYWGVDCWSIGIIISEMISGVPLIPGDSEIDQLFKIFRIFGTPSADEWPGVVKLSNWQMQFPKFSPTNLLRVLPRGDPQLLDIIAKLCRYRTDSRLRANHALQHEYFRPITQASFYDVNISPEMRKMNRRISSSVTISPPDSALTQKRSFRRVLSPSASKHVMDGHAALQACQERSHGLLKRSMSTLVVDNNLI